MDQDALTSIMFMGVFIVALPLIILIIIGAYRIFEKAGEKGWKCLIPIYNLIVLLKIVGKPWWWLFFFIVPYIRFAWNDQFVSMGFSIVSLVFGIWVTNLLAKSFGKNEGFTVGLFFLPFVFYMILGLGKDKYLGPYGNPATFKAFRDTQAGNGFDFDQNVLNH